MIIIRPTSPSRGATTLKKALRLAGHKTVISYRTTFRPRNRVITWGKESDKLTAFRKLSAVGVRHPEITTSLPAQGRTGIWLARTLLNASCGRGIIVIRKDDPVPPAPLYVKYVPKQEEYRVHVFEGKTIFVQQKRRRRGHEFTRDQKLIRNHDNGWVFCKDNVEISNETKALAERAAVALGLQVAAVDLVISVDDGLPYILECNSKPGLESESCIRAYVEAITNDR